MFDVIIESKHIELTELQLRFLSKNSKFINKFIILINSNDALIDFKLKLLKHQINIDFEIIPYNKLVNKNLFNFIDSNFNENKKYLFVSAFISYLGGKVEYRTDRQGNVHVPIGKVSFEVPAIVANLRAVLEELEKAKPASAKGRYFKKVSLSSTMGPGVKLDSQRMLAVEEV